ncbi:MAG TPA: hypothetical protein VIY48_10535 [Candidatus Paceibacterota bacterium]
MSISQDKKLVYPVTKATYDYANLVRREWGAEWSKRDIVYEFSNGRIFRDSFTQGGPYGNPSV